VGHLESGVGVGRRRQHRAFPLEQVRRRLQQLVEAERQSRAAQPIQLLYQSAGQVVGGATSKILRGSNLRPTVHVLQNVTQSLTVSSDDYVNLIRLTDAGKISIGW